MFYTIHPRQMCIVLGILDIFAICTSSLLHYWNTSMKAKSAFKRLSLAERYQVNENIRYMRIILPFIITCCILSLTCNIILLAFIYGAKLSTRQNIIAFQIVFALFTFSQIAAIIYRWKLSQYISSSRQQTKANSVSIIGREIDVHFVSLKNSWENQALKINS
uniref:G protein-coupled receptor n=1 Tax=Panagrolaimus davidi TaxID=227884 RepID=A0A914QXT4_9BILA